MTTKNRVYTSKTLRGSGLFYKAYLRGLCLCCNGFNRRIVSIFLINDLGLLYNPINTKIIAYSGAKNEIPRH
jgi:hypothetical protein